MVLIKTLGSVSLAVAASSCFILAAANPAVAPNVTYTATGVFASPAMSGDDLFELAGQPFSISIVANAAMPPSSHGPHWAQYKDLKMTGTVTSGLEPSPLTISSGHTSMELATGNPSYDVFEMFAPINVIGIEINVLANVQMPPGTISNALIQPFAAIALGPPDTVTYSDTTTGTSTTLQIASGTLAAAIPSSSDTIEARAVVQLHTEGAQVITAHADGTRSTRSIGRSAIDLGAESDVVALEFYASGVRDAAEIRVRIAGENVPVFYAGPAGRFAGLDEVSVALPRSLAGRGTVDVALTVDGQTARPVNIQIQ